MKIFDKAEPWPTKVNFVDENNVVLGYEMLMTHDEEAWWFIANTEVEYPQHCHSFIDCTEKELEDYTFDITYNKYVETDRKFDDGGLYIFRIKNAEGNFKYIHLCNIHNGYYTHGFEFSQGKRTIIKGEI